MGKSLDKQVLDDILNGAKIDLRTRIIHMKNESINLANVLECLPDVLRLVLKPIQKGLYTPSDYVSNLPESPVSDKRNTDALSDLHAYVDSFINDGLFQGMSLADNNFRPMDLEYSLRILGDVEVFVRMVYEANREKIANLNCVASQKVNPFSGSGLRKNLEFGRFYRHPRIRLSGPFYEKGDPIGKLKALHPVEKSVRTLAPFLEMYKTVKRAEYISAFREHMTLVYGTSRQDPIFNKVVTAISKYHKLYPDFTFTMAFVLPNLRKTERMLIEELPAYFKSPQDRTG